MREPEAPRDRGPSTKQLLQAYLSGTGQAQGELFERHRGQLLKFASEHAHMRGLRRHTSAEEVVSEAFLRALSSNLLRSFEDRGPGSLRNLLMRIVERVLVDMKRRFEAQKRGGGEIHVSVHTTSQGQRPLHERIPSSDTSPTQAAAGSDLLHACREILPEREREVWGLIVERGLAMGDAATQMGVSESTVRSLLFRARERVRKHLE